MIENNGEVPIWDVNSDAVSYKGYLGLFLYIWNGHIRKDKGTAYVRWSQIFTDSPCSRFQAILEELEDLLREKIRCTETYISLDCRVRKLLTFLDRECLISLLFTSHEEVRVLVVEELKRRPTCLS